MSSPNDIVITVAQIINGSEPDTFDMESLSREKLLDELTSFFL